jgi:hypothetical protein
VDRGREHVSIHFVVRHPRNQVLMIPNPGIAEVSAQLNFKVGG